MKIIFVKHSILELNIQNQVTWKYLEIKIFSYSYHQLYRKDYSIAVIKLGSQISKVFLSNSVFTLFIVL